MKYLIGIDLGTTNTVVHYCDLKAETGAINTLHIPQVTELGERENLPSLPSFIYLPEGEEVPKGSLALPWDENPDFAVGAYAAKNSAKLPDRVIYSSKSWLSVESVNRRDAILPWGRKNKEYQLSPVDAAAKILRYIRDAWNSQFTLENKDDKIENQTVVLTVPASFDAVARELTTAAAKEIGLDVILQEEPLAAFYSWLFTHNETWRDKVNPGDVILVCDIGGGTSDFTLIKVQDEEGHLALERLAVGKHLLLGGDNMDFAVAYTAAARFRQEQNTNLDQYQIKGLIHACRQNKEQMLANAESSDCKLTVLGRGSSILGNAISIEMGRDEMMKVIVDGFLPECSLQDRPAKRQASGLQSFGLAYETDPAITKHLAEFISAHCHSTEDMPNTILFNGGVTHAEPVRERIVGQLEKWAEQEVNILVNEEPDMAVSNGAVYYAQVRSGGGIKVKAGSSHAYYIGVESSMPAIPGFVPPQNGVCIVPIGMEEGSAADIPYEGLGVVVGEDTYFDVYASTTRDEDIFGTLLEEASVSEELEKLPQLRTKLEADEELPSGSLIPVVLHSELTETGTLQLSCINPDSGRKWKLDFELRSS